MGMLLTSEDVAKAELSEVGQVLNGVDNANIMSVDSTTPFTTPTDELQNDEAIKETVTPAVEVKPKVDEVIEDKKPDEKPATKETAKVEIEPDVIQKRINEITKKRRVAERERDYERDKRLELEEELKKLRAAVPPTDKPNRDNFDTDLEFFEALTDWKVEQKLKVSKEDSEKVSKEVAEKQDISAAYEELDSIMERGRGKYQDFNQLVLDEKLIITENMTEVILQSEVADEIMYYLGKNPDESAKLAKLSPLKAAAEIGKIEVKLTTKVAPPPEVKKKTTTAPEPITPVRTTGVSEKDPGDMTPKEYRAWREKNK